MLAWMITGFIFFIKPGYDEAFEMPQIKSYPVKDTLIVIPNPEWKSAKLIRTILGNHLIASTSEGLKNIDPFSNKEIPEPAFDEIKILLDDALSVNASRYGSVKDFNDGYYLTSTGVKITFDWNSLLIAQSGSDTEIINTFYKIHYLQWTGFELVDKVLGFAGLLLIGFLTFFGTMLLFKK